jgi:hypothetical protein
MRGSEFESGLLSPADGLGLDGVAISVDGRVRRVRFEYAAGEAQRYRVGPVLCSEPMEDMHRVGAHGRWGDAELDGDLMCYRTSRNEAQNVELA